MPDRELTAEESAVVAALVEFYRGKAQLLKGILAFVQELVTADVLSPFVHSVKTRIKSETSMHRKLKKKLIKCADDGRPLDITVDNFFQLVNDSIGARILHLSSFEFASIHPALIELFRISDVVLLEQPKAYTWDPGYKRMFEGLGLAVEENPRFYTSVHYVIAGPGPITWSAEIQVRTLAEELWGEVDHKFNYPDEHPNPACGEQIRALARQVGSCSSLVDAIYKSAQEQ